MRKIRPPEFHPERNTPPEMRGKLAKSLARCHGSYPVAIRLKCLDCSGWIYKEAKLCTVTSCPLWAIRRYVFKC